MRIVLVEDNEGLAKGIAYRLGDLGHAIDLLSDGLAAEAHLRDDGADMVVLDINLPQLDGLSILRGMRERGDDRPVLLLTARSETIDLVRGLDAGADDYLVKPFEMDELEARVRALARRLPRPLRRQSRFGALAFDLDSRQVSVDGDALTLPRREVGLVEILIGAQGRTVSKQDLLDHLYGLGTDVEEAVIEVHVSRLRKRLKPYGVQIRVQRGLGYALAEEALGAA
jgi:DNA-binding response OmpR family regulator